VARDTLDFMTVAAEVLDFYDDSQHELMAKLAMPSQLRDVQMNVLTAEQRDTLPDSEFGLIVLTKRASVLRKFPVNDPGNAWMSAQYFQQTHEKLAFPARFVAAKFIKEACDAYRISSSPRVAAYAARADDDIANNVFIEGSESSWMLRKMAQRELDRHPDSAAEVDALVNLPDEHFALVVQNGDGSVIRKYAMPNGEYVRRAAGYFDKYAMQLAPEHRHRFAASVQSRADELGVDLADHPQLYKWASSDWNRHVVAHLEQRKSLLPRNPDAREILDKLAASIGETTPADMAAALQTLDEATGLTRYYDRGLTDPYASTMGKVAEGWSTEVDGHTLTADDLRKVAASSKLAGYLGDTFARQFAENPVEIFDSLPSPEKVLIKQIASGEA
jgi:hypothetical protein